MPAPIQLLHADTTLVLAQSEQLMLAVWWDAPTSDQMDIIERFSRRIRREWTGQNGFVQYVLAGTPHFSSEVRRKATEQTRAHAALGTAHVIEIEGLAGSAARAFLSALILLTQRDKPIKVFSTAEDAAAWLASKMGPTSGGWTSARILDLRRQAIAARG